MAGLNTWTEVFEMLLITLSMAVLDVAVTLVGSFTDQFKLKESRMSRSRWVLGSLWSRTLMLMSPTKMNLCFFEKKKFNKMSSLSQKVLKHPLGDLYSPATKTLPSDVV